MSVRFFLSQESKGSGALSQSQVMFAHLRSVEQTGVRVLRAYVTAAAHVFSARAPSLQLTYAAQATLQTF